MKKEKNESNCITSSSSKEEISSFFSSQFKIAKEIQDNIKKEDISGDILLDLSDNDLKKIGLKIGPIKKIKKYLGENKANFPEKIIEEKIDDSSSVEDVKNFFEKSIGFKMDSDFDGKKLLELKNEDIQNLGLNLGQRKKLEKYIKHFKTKISENNEKINKEKKKPAVKVKDLKKEEKKEDKKNEGEAPPPHPNINKEQEKKGEQEKEEQKEKQKKENEIDDKINEQKKVKKVDKEGEKEEDKKEEKEENKDEDKEEDKKVKKVDKEGEKEEDKKEEKEENTDEEKEEDKNGEKEENKDEEKEEDKNGENIDDNKEEIQRDNGINEENPSNLENIDKEIIEEKEKEQKEIVEPPKIIYQNIDSVEIKPLNIESKNNIFFILSIKDDFYLNSNLSTYEITEDKQIINHPYNILLNEEIYPLNEDKKRMLLIQLPLEKNINKLWINVLINNKESEEKEMKDKKEDGKEKIEEEKEEGEL